MKLIEAKIDKLHAATLRRKDVASEMGSVKMTEEEGEESD